MDHGDLKQQAQNIINLFHRIFLDAGKKSIAVARKKQSYKILKDEKDQER